jgi:hypothetical protein
MPISEAADKLSQPEMAELLMWEFYLRAKEDEERIYLKQQEFLRLSDEISDAIYSPTSLRWRQERGKHEFRQ